MENEVIDADIDDADISVMPAHLGLDVPIWISASPSYRRNPTRRSLRCAASLTTYLIAAEKRGSYHVPLAERIVPVATTIELHSSLVPLRFVARLWIGADIASVISSFSDELYALYVLKEGVIALMTRYWHGVNVTMKTTDADSDLQSSYLPPIALVDIQLTIDVLYTTNRDNFSGSTSLTISS
ncbi:hypothetical protein M422DRAFT_249864 [Sphaerobolus stellatus SS14]|uniref:Uncharacterized protein n=1 Tax=Sphaerobolus stellatus (strain SS14) TaxID=990650 RepID=A0A0C9VUQ6_SPHS4|nr:hypothetical protein M422DRAFT_249864 [Sphaerobolus stellatus SS14]